MRPSKTSFPSQRPAKRSHSSTVTSSDTPADQAVLDAAGGADDGRVVTGNRLRGQHDAAVMAEPRPPLTRVRHLGQTVCRSRSRRLKSAPQNWHFGARSSRGPPHEEQRTTAASWPFGCSTVTTVPQ